MYVGNFFTFLYSVFFKYKPPIWISKIKNSTLTLLKNIISLTRDVFVFPSTGSGIVIDTINGPTSGARAGTGLGAYVSVELVLKQLLYHLVNACPYLSFLLLMEHLISF